MRALYCICAVLALLAPPAAGQTPPVSPSTTSYTLFLRGVPIGSEDITVAGGNGLVVRSRGTFGPPLSSVLRDVELRYGPDGAPRSFKLDGFINGADINLSTTIITDGTATTTGSHGARTIASTQKVAADAVLLPPGMFAGYAALPPRLLKLRVTDEFPVFSVPNREVRARVVEVEAERMQTGTTLVDVRRYELAVAEPDGDVVVQLTVTPQGALVRVNIPSQAIDLVRRDFAGANSRTEVYSNPGDQAVTIPAEGFNLGATLTLPSPTAPATGTNDARRPAVILLAGPDAPDRDAIAPDAPARGRLAGALADAGVIAIRYDRRGTGQSGGRAESATLNDYADDVRTVAKWLSNRKDVDSKRIAVIGHGEGAWIGLLAASRDSRIAAVASIAAPSTAGAAWVLEQQQIQLDRMRTPVEERDAKVALQKQIHAAVLSGRGWEALVPELRKQADTPYFQSFLKYDPSKVVDGIDAPILVLHGELDREVPVAHAEGIARIAREGDSRAVELVTVRGVNHLLMPAVTGEVGEYATLPDRMISKDVVTTLVDWLARTLPAPKGR